MSLKKNILFFLVILLFASTPIFASGKTDKIVETVKTGTVEQLKKSLKKDSDLIGVTSGADKETLLMIAVKENREIDIINILLKAGIDPAKKTKSGKTALMFACQYESNNDVIEKIINSGTYFFSSIRRSRVLAKDKEKKSSFDYARQGKNSEKIINTLSKYAEDPAVAAEKKAKKIADKEAAKQEKKNQNSSKENSETNTSTTSVETTPDNAAATVIASSTTVAAEAATTTAVASSAHVIATAPTTTAAASTVVTGIALSSENEEENYEQESELTKRLLKIIKTGKVDQIKSILKSYPELINKTVGADNETLLMIALKANRNNVVIKELLRLGLAIDATTNSGKTALMFACQYESDLSAIEMLIISDTIITPNSSFSIIKKQNADNTTDSNHYNKLASRKRVLTKDNNGYNVFDYAKLNKNSEAVISLLRKYIEDYVKEVVSKAEEESKKTGKEVELDETIAAIAPIVTAPAVVAAPPAPPAPVVVPETVVPESIDKPVPEVHPYKKVYLFDYNELDDENFSELPEDVVSENDNLTFIEDADARDSQGRTKLMIASRDGDIKMMRNLLYSGAEVQAYDDDGWTPLMFASRYNTNPEVVQILLYNGAVVSTKNKYGISSLQLAAGFNPNPNVISLLLKGRSIAEEEIRSSFIYAVTSESNTSILKAFVDSGIPVNISYQGKTPLMYAAESNTKTDLIAWLLEHGANSGYRTVQGMTAFDFAQQNKRIPHDKVYWSLNKTPSTNKDAN